MIKKGNTYYFTHPVKKTLKYLLDKRYGKITSPADFDSTGDYDTGVEGHVKACTGKLLSGSTLERLVGLRENENKGVLKATLQIVAEYLGFESLDSMLASIQQPSAFRSDPKKQFNISQLIQQYIIRVHMPSEKLLDIKHLNENQFEVIFSKNLMLQNGDIVEIAQLNINDELICNRVKRNHGKKLASLGQYRSGSRNQIISLELIK
ncbi:MAG: hypothetical protein RBT74_14850 [Tenuifilaceae bacterium]|jgi:hypothetical protein|nr:hypothetical protein [Tenuifilaceae bacterium]